MKKVLFVCIHNSARSQMAEAFVNKYGKGKIIAESAGLEPGKLNPIVVECREQASRPYHYAYCKLADQTL